MNRILSAVAVMDKSSLFDLKAGCVSSVAPFLDPRSLREATEFKYLSEPGLLMDKILQYKKPRVIALTKAFIKGHPLKYAEYVLCAGF